MEYIKKLEAYGGIDEIYAAIDTYDMAKTVSMATNVLKKINHLNNQKSFIKSKKLSKKFLQESMEINLIGLYHLAVYRNNMALAFAPTGSREMMLAYGMRAEYMFSIKNYTACQNDVKTCLAMNCPKSYGKKLKKISEDSKRMLETQHSARILFQTLGSFFQFDCKRNAAVPCASADVAFVNQDGAKRVTAGKDIPTGVVVVIEQAFASFVTVKNKYLACYYCNRMTPLLQPCNGCSQALFCNVKCRDRCMKEYHRIECQIVDYLVLENLKVNVTLVTRTAIKLSLKLGWDALIKESENIGSSRMRIATVRDTYNTDEPLSILSYDDEEYLVEGKMFNGSLIIAKIIHSLDKVPNYFPTEPSKRKAAKEAMSRIMLQLYVTFNNTIPITCAANSYDTESMSTKVSEEHTNYGWFSMCSKLKHSCEPNLMVVGLNDSVALVTLRRIKQGEELTISYTKHFYSDDIMEYAQTPYKRATNLFLTIGHICKDCKVCKEDWNKDSDEIPAAVTWERALLRAQRINCNSEKELYQTICEIMNMFPLRTYDHKQAFLSFERMMIMAQCYHTKNISISFS